MAVFLINICKFNGCGITFPSLGDLIQHIEDTHIDNDPYVLQQKEQSRPQCIPLSYALRFITDAARKEGLYPGSTGVELKRKLAIKHHSYSLSSNRSTTPIASDIDEDEMEVSESDSNDSWTTEEFSSEFIMKYGSRHSGTNSNGNSGNNEKPFACPVPGCKKRYKNVNGIKYHSKNGHKKDGKIRKSFKCYCGKSYKTSQGLKSHSSIAHNSSAENRSTSPISISVATSSLSSSSSSISSLINSPITSICGGDLSSSSSNSSSNQSNINTSINNNNNNNTSTSSNSNNNNSSSGSNNSNNNNTNSNTTISNNTNSIISNNGNNANITKNNNYNLIAIKTTNPTLVKTQSGKKLFKIVQDDSIENSNKLESSTIKMTLPNLMNLGILTPATSPSQIQQQQQQQNQIIHNNNNNNFNINTNNENSSGSSTTSTTMPLTPISPNMSKNINFVTSNEITIITQQT